MSGNNNSGDDSFCGKLMLGILACILPPLAVGIKEEACNGHFWLSVLLTIILFIPGVLHALYIVCR